MKNVLAAAIVFGAAVLEVGGDAAIRRGFTGSGWPWTLVGVVALAGYGCFVNYQTSVSFGRLLGAYVALFFVVSQAYSVWWLGEKMPRPRWVGGALIVVGGVVITIWERWAPK